MWIVPDSTEELPTHLSVRENTFVREDVHSPTRRLQDVAYPRWFETVMSTLLEPSTSPVEDSSPEPPPPSRKTLVVMPAWNEAEALPSTIAQLQQLPDEFELLVVDDGSTDGTAIVARQLARTSRLPLHVVSLSSNSGIGAAVQTGYLFAATQDRYRYVIQFDADGQHDAGSIAALVAACERDGLDLCVGSRFLADSMSSFRSTWLRRRGIWFFARLISLLTGATVTDPTSGFRCAGEKAWRAFAERYPDDYPEPESLFWCARNGLRVSEIPVQMHQRQGGVSSIHSLRSAYYMVKVTIAILIDRFRPLERLEA